MTSVERDRQAVQPLSNDRVVAEVRPAEGGRIQTIVDLESGRELLWQGKDGRWPRDDFVDGCPGGWDELFPTDTPWEGHPDHGCLWSSAFEVTETAPSPVAVTLRTRLDTPPVDIRRRYSLLQDGRAGVRVETTMEGRAATGPVLWAGHPFLNVRPGWQIGLAARELDVDAELSGRFSGEVTISGEEQRQACTIPEARQGLLEVLYAANVSEARVASPDGQAVTRVAWDPEFFPYAWIVTVSGELGWDLAFLVCPATSRPFRLGECAENGTAVVCNPGDTRSWWMEVESLDVAPSVKL